MKKKDTLSKKDLEDWKNFIEDTSQLTDKDTKQLYLGKFLQSNVLLWSNDKIIKDGLAVFEYGCIRFPDYRHVKIWTGKVIDHSHLQSLPMYKVYDNDLSCH